MIYGNFNGGKKYKTTNTLDGGHFSGVPWVSALIEGKGRYTNPTTGITSFFRYKFSRKIKAFYLPNFRIES